MRPRGCVRACTRSSTRAGAPVRACAFRARGRACALPLRARVRACASYPRVRAFPVRGVPWCAVVWRRWVGDGWWRWVVVWCGGVGAGWVGLWAVLGCAGIPLFCIPLFRWVVVAACLFFSFVSLYRWRWCWRWCWHPSFSLAAVGACLFSCTYRSLYRYLYRYVYRYVFVRSLSLFRLS